MAQISFGQCLQQILKSRRCSIVQLQKKLGYKSATTVSRVLHDTSSISLAERLLQQLLMTDFLALNPDEILMLQQALHKDSGTLMKEEAYERLSMLFRPLPKPDDVYFRVFSPGERRFSLSQWQEVLEKGQSLFDLIRGKEGPRIGLVGGLVNIARMDVILFGNFNHTLMIQLLGLFNFVPKDVLKVRHYFELEDNPLELADLLLSLSSVFFSPWYEAFFSTVKENKADVSPSFLRNVAIFRFETKDGDLFTYDVRLADDYELCLWNHQGDDAPYAAINSLVASSGELKNYRPARKELMENHTLEDLLTLYRRMYFMERDRTWRIIIPTMSMCYVPAEIMMHNASLFLGEGASDPAQQEIAKAVIDLHAARYDNKYKKKKPTYMILSRRALQRLAREGYMHDHPYGFPPFTVEERLVILSTFVKNCRENPYFHTYVALDSFRFGEVSYCCFDNLGLHICETNIDYQVGTPVQEVVMAIDGILQLFENYFDDELLKKHVDSEAASLVFLEGLLAELKAINGTRQG
ncbi:MAG: hypothetical protein FWF86_02850 [Clostridia bacterium]|nr:hypothetical protein [Clostridia bacterium]